MSLLRIPSFSGRAFEEDLVKQFKSGKVTGPLPDERHRLFFLRRFYNDYVLYLRLEGKEFS